MNFKKNIVIAISFLLICFISIGIYISGFAYEVYFNGEKIALVKDTDDFNQALSSVDREIAIWYRNKNITFDKDVSFKKIRLTNDDDIKSVSQLKEEIYLSGLDLSIMGSAIIIDDQEVVYLSSANQAEEVIEKVIKTFINVEDTEKLLKYDIKENYSIIDKKIQYEKLKKVDQAVTFILHGTDEIVEYSVESGDTTWDIATSRGLSINEIELANPDKNINRLHKGETLNLTVSKPFFTVSVVKEVMYNEKISFGTTYVNDSSLYVGQSKIKESGKYGTKEITAKITYDNGIEINREIKNEKTIKEPKNQIVVKGTKALPAVIGTGNYVIPAGGRITAYNKPGSHSGGRALDIANSSAPSVYAADAGVIKSVKYDANGYGKYIIIDHGGGYSTLYAHLSKAYVSTGQRVSQGQSIGKMGNTGYSTGTHLHFEVRYNNSRQVLSKYFSSLKVGQYVVAKH